MRLTLRTLLAYLDQVLDEQTAAEIAEKIRQSEVAPEILQRIEDVLRRPKLGAPELSGRGMKVDPNTVAEYLDNVLSKDQVADFEKGCLESNTLLAEVASCHQVLANILDEPVEVPLEYREKLYQLCQRGKELHGPDSGNARKEQVAVPVEKPLSADDDELLVRPPAQETNWRWLLAAALAAVLVVSTLLSVSPEGFWKGGQDQWARKDSLPPAPPEPSQPPPPPQVQPPETRPPRSEQAPKPSPEVVPPQQPPMPPSKSEPPAPLPEPAEPVPRLPEGTPPAVKKKQEQPGREGGPADSEPRPVRPLPAPEKPVRPLPPPRSDSVPKPSETLGKLTSQGALLYRPRGKDNWDWVHENLTPLLAGDRLIVPYGFTATVVMNDGVQLQLFSQTQLQLPPVWPSPEKPLRLVRGRIVVLTPGRQVVRVPVQFGTLAGQVELLTPGAALACEVGYQRPLGTDLQAPSQMVVSLFCVAGTLRWYDQRQQVTQVEQNGRIVLRSGQRPQTQGQASPPDWLHRDALPQLIQEATLELLELLHQELDQADAGKDVEVVLRETAQQHRHIEVRYLALVHLMDLGIFDPAVDALREPRFRLGNHWEKLLDQLYQAAIVSPETAQRVREAFLQRRGESVGQQLFLLLRGFSREELMQETVANQVVALLGHGDLDFRRLTLWNLKRALDVRNTSYQPHAPNHRGVLEWRNRLQRLRKQAARVDRK